VWDWLIKLSKHSEGGFALIMARTKPEGFHRAVWRQADALFFFKGRLHFHLPTTGERAKGNAGAPSVLVAYGSEAVGRLEKFSLIEGQLVNL